MIADWCKQTIGTIRVKYSMIPGKWLRLFCRDVSAYYRGHGYCNTMYCNVWHFSCLQLDIHPTLSPSGFVYRSTLDSTDAYFAANFSLFPYHDSSLKMIISDYTSRYWLDLKLITSALCDKKLTINLSVNIVAMDY